MTSPNPFLERPKKLLYLGRRFAQKIQRRKRKCFLERGGEETLSQKQRDMRSRPPYCPFSQL